MKARGYYMKNTKSYANAAPIIKEVMNNNFNNVKILYETDYGGVKLK